MTLLAALAERHRADPEASAPRLEPRIPSRFEPVATAVEPGRAVPDLVIEAVRDAEAPAPRARRHAPRPPRADGEPFGDPDPRLTTLTAALSAARATVTVPVPATPPGTPVGTVSRAADTLPAPAHEDVRTETRDGIQATAPRPERPRRPSLEPPPERRPAPSVSAPLRARREGTPPPAPTTVHVSIGRVDVRAIVAPAAASPARPPSPASRPSLEDYLRGRQRGSR